MYDCEWRNQWVVIQADALSQVPSSGAGVAGRCRVCRRYVGTCMCFVWVPFRDTKCMLLLHFYHTLRTFNNVKYWRFFLLDLASKLTFAIKSATKVFKISWTGRKKLHWHMHHSQVSGFGIKANKHCQIQTGGSWTGRSDTTESCIGICIFV